MSPSTSPKEFKDAYSTLFKTFASGKTKSLKWRKWQLKQLWLLVTENETEIVEVLKKDLNRHAYENYASDLVAMKRDIQAHLTNLEIWTADEKPDAGHVMGTLGKARIRHEPLGVVLIIGPWNFPISLLLQPLVAAITAGCAIMLKPSELAPASEEFLSKIVPKYLDQEAIRIATGGPAETEKILEHRFNHIFFTGSGKVALFVAAAAAKHLTPTVLELGGQGPAIVTSTANVDLAAKRIAYVKYLNAGQICLSVNHVFADPQIHDEFVERLGYWFDKYMVEPSGFTRIINSRNFDRLENILQNTEGEIAYGGKTDRDDRFIHPTVVTGVTLKDSLMQEELFGPLVPIIKADSTTAYKTILSMEHPLAIYIFSTDKNEIDETDLATVLDHTNSGGVTINDVLMHAGVHGAPFGGVGGSGNGYYHGKYGYLSFTHLRTVVEPPAFLEEALSFRYPSYSLENIAKVATEDTHGIKPVERMEDQEILVPKLANGAS